MGKCECYIHSLKQGEKHVLGEARIIKRLGDNDYLAEYNGVRCHAIFNPFVGKFIVDDVYGIVRKSPADRTRYKWQQEAGAKPVSCCRERRTQYE